MNRPKVGLALALSASLLSACAPQPYVKKELPPLPTQNLRLALVISPKTREAVKYLQSHNGSNRDIEPFTQGNRPFETIAATLQNSFETVRTVESLEEAKTANADLIGVLDMSVRIRIHSMAQALFWGYVPPVLGNIINIYVNRNKARLEVVLSLQTLDQKPVETIRALSDQDRRPQHGMNFVITYASDDVAWQIKNALGRSSALAELASKPRQPQPATAPVAAPAAPAGLPKSSVAAPSYQLPEDPNRFAIVVGVEKYGSLPEAQFAERDAAAVRQHLLALGYPARNVLYLSGERASRSALEKYVEAWLPRNVNEESKVLFYFSGHGAPDPESKEVFLVPWDGDPKFLKDTSYPLKRLYAKLNALKAKEILVAMDSCFSGAGGRSVLAQGTRPLVAKVDLSTGEIGRLVVLAASAADQITGADEVEGHGLFTYNLLRALDERKGDAKVRELYEALVPKVRDAARRQNREQTPQLLAASPGVPMKF